MNGKKAMSIMGFIVGVYTIITSITNFAHADDKLYTIEEGGDYENCDYIILKKTAIDDKE